MLKTEIWLFEMLEEIAKKDLTKGHNVYDHPCSIAVRRLKKLEQYLSEDEEMCVTYH